MSSTLKSDMTKTEQRIHTLRTELHRHNHLYHTKGTTEITDAQFDQMLAELQKLETEHPEFADPNSPTSRVGSQPFDGFATHTHAVRMLSLDKFFNIDDLLAWWTANPHIITIEPKIDGISLDLRYENGALVRAVTRGDGTVGAVCTENARAISSIPLILSTPFTGHVRGEVYMSRQSFAENNRRLEDEGEEPFANPRNAAAGTFKSLDPRVVAQRKLDFVAYQVIDQLTLGLHDTLERLTNWGFITPGTLSLRAGVGCYGLTFAPDPLVMSHIPKVIENMGGLNDKLPVETDGLVIKFTDPKVREELGAGTRSLKWAVAFKFPPKRVPTKLLGIELTVGRTGMVVPNARLKPVQVCGTTVSNASLCNQDEVDRLGIRIGDTVYVEKSGEIIPKVVGIAETCDNAEIPEYGSEAAAKRAWKFPTHYVDTYTGQQGTRAIIHLCRVGVHYWLSSAGISMDCLHARLTHATSKLALDWDGCGPAQIATLLAHGTRDLIGLFMVAPANTGLEGKALERFLSSREEVKRRPLWRFFRAICTDGVGSTYCKQLASVGRNWRGVLAIPLWRLEELMGPVKANAFHCVHDELEKIFQQLESLGCVLDDDKLAGGGKQPLKGLVFCVTGTLSKGRDEVQALIESAGGLAKSGVTKATNYLVVGDEPGGSKLKAAEKHGTKQITEAELYALMQ